MGGGVFACISSCSVVAIKAGMSRHSHVCNTVIKEVLSCQEEVRSILFFCACACMCVGSRHIRHPVYNCSP